MTVGAICNRRIPTAAGSTSMLEAAKSMRALDEKVLVVTEEKGGRLFAAGIVTEREFVSSVVARGADPSALTLQDVMRTRFGFVTETDRVVDTACWMHRNHLREAVVHDQDGALVGVVTLDQLVDSIAEEVAGSATPAADEPLVQGRPALH